MSVAATLVNAVEQINEPFTLKMNNCQKFSITGKAKGQFLAEAMEKLALVRPTGLISVYSFLKYNAHLFKSGSTLIIVTNTYDRQLQDTLAFIANKRIKVDVLLVGENNYNTESSFVTNITKLSDMADGGNIGGEVGANQIS